jgi:hypothetical protein
MHISHNVFSHRCIKVLAFHSQVIYTLRQHKYFPSTQNNRSDRSWSSCSSSTSSILLQHELSYPSDAAENQRHSQKAPSYTVLLSKIILFVFLQNSLPNNFSSLLLSKTAALPAVWYLSLLYVVRPTLPRLSSLKQPSDPFSFRRPLLLPEASPNLSVPFQSDSQSAVLPSSLNRLHQCWPPYPFLLSHHNCMQPKLNWNFIQLNSNSISFE